MHNDWTWPYSVHNYITISVLITLYTIQGCVVFNFIHTPCKYGDIWDIIRIGRIKYEFMRVTTQIFDTALETLENRNSRCPIFGYPAEGCCKNTNSAHNSNMMYPAKSMSKFNIISNFCLRLVPVRIFYFALIICYVEKTTPTL